MAAVCAPEQGDCTSCMTKTNQTQDDRGVESEGPVGRIEHGKIYLEARVDDDFTGDFVKLRNDIIHTFSLEIVQNLCLVLWQEMLESDAFKGLFHEVVQSLKAVEYVGTELSATYFPIKSICLEVQVYRMSSSLEHLKDEGTLLQAEIIQLPSSRFEGMWEKLVFDNDIRGNLIRLMTNMLKFSRALSTANLRPRTNRLILLSGPPGTGKTTICQALAQKLSIRLNQAYPSTSLIQINAATLLSKFFSESAKHILQIFTAILAHCTSSPSHFTIVLIDEIESLASSRTSASSRGEVQDTIRATNALLTGFDKVKSQPNLIILCTSNMIDTLDAAFLDRCGHQIVIEEPSLAARYQILRDGIQDLIVAGIIKSERSEHKEHSGQAEQTELLVPSYRDAQLELLSEPKKPGSVLMELCNALDPSTCQQRLGIEGRGRTSARYLGQLPEVALADQLITDSCNLDEALEHMSKFVYAQIRLETDQTEARRQLGESENGYEDRGLGLKRKRV